MRIKQLINKVIAPITEEFVFFFFCLVLLLPRTMMFPFLRPDMCFGIWTEFPTLKFISIGIFFSYLFSTLVYVTKSCLIKGFVYLVLYLLFFLNIYLAFSFAATVSPNTLLLLFETTPSEAHDFLSTYAFTIKSFIAYVLIIVVLLVNVLLEYKKGAIRKYLISNKTFMKCKAYVKNCLLMLLVCGLFTSQTSFSLFSIRKVEDIEKWNSQGIASMDLLTGFMYSVRHLELMGDILSIAEISTEKAVAMHHDLLYSEDSCNVVLVIGESFIKAHSSLYGYGLDTNPRLMKEKSKGRLITFSDVVTPYSGTSSAIRNVMSCNSIGNGEKWCDSPYFPAIFKKAGYSDEQIEKIPNTIELKNTDSVKFSNQEIEDLVKKYSEIIKQNLSGDRFSKKKNQTIIIDEKNITTDEYILKLSKEELNTTYVKLLENLKDDEIILKKIEIIQKNLRADLLEILGIDVSKFNKINIANLKDSYINNIETEIQKINKINIGNEECQIVVYGNKDNVYKTIFNKPDGEISFEHCKSDKIFSSINRTKEGEKVESITLKEKDNNIEIIFKDNEKAPTILVKYESNQKIDNEKCNKDINLKYEYNNNRLEINCMERFDLENEIKNKIDFDNENSINLNYLDTSEIKALIDKVKADLKLKKDEIIQNINTNEIVDILKNMGIKKEKIIIENERSF